MIRGEVDDEGFPFILLEVGGSTWKATVDTGFNGDLELPMALYSFVKPRFYARATSFLAGDQVIEEDNYIVQFPFDGSVVRAVATFVPGDGILLGTNMLRDSRLLIDFPRQEVTLE